MDKDMQGQAEVVPIQKRTYVVEGTEAGGFVPLGDLDNDVAARIYAQLRDELGEPEAVMDEIDRMLEQVRDLWILEPDQAGRAIAAMSSRCTQLHVLLHRVEGKDRRFRQIRTQQVGPLLEELDRQFRIASRSVELRRQDLDLMGRG